jgi:uracil-DNA glycosylase
MKKDIFDEIIGHLQELQSQSKTTFIAPEIVNEFFTDTQVAPTPRPISVPVQTSAPALFSTESIDPAIAKMTLEELNFIAQNCKKCPLCSERKNVVFGEGSPNADLMFIGEGPGYDEDQQGRPFVGKAGDLLTKMITAMQFSREQVYISNIVKCRPPKNRNPLPEEANVCLSYLQRQIELIQPKVIVILGAVPLKYLLNKVGITRLRGQWDSYNGIKVMPTFHPAYLLRDPKAKGVTWSDLQQVMKSFGKVHKK